MQNVRILITDNDPQRTLWGRALKLVGFEVQTTKSRREALALLQQKLFDLLLLNIDLPDLQGMELLTQIRHQWPQMLVVVLAENASLKTAVSAFKLDAVDYLQKPVSLNILLDTVNEALYKQKTYQQKVHLARMLQRFPDLVTGTGSVKLVAPSVEKQPAAALCVPPLLLNRFDRSVKFVNDPERLEFLSPSETAVLYTLMSYPDQVLSCPQLVQGAWGNETDESHAQNLVRPVILRLRRKLEEKPTNPCLIHTVRGKGYMLVTT